MATQHEYGRVLRPGHWCLAIVLACLSPAGVFAQALTPQSPAVRQAINRAMGFLDTAVDSRLGAQALVGRAMIATGRRDDPHVKNAADAIRSQLAGTFNEDIYTLGICILFLIELDAKENSSEIRKLLENLHRRQKPNGGWGYDNRPTSDTSMTQYAVLSAWSAAEADFRSPDSMWIAVMNWFLRTQDPSGAFGYQGVESPGDQLVQQNEVSVTLTYAGLASLYLCGDQLGLVRLSTSGDSEVPDVFRKREQTAAPGAAGVKTDSPINAARFHATIERALKWYSEHERLKSNRYPFYFFYTLERMETIREAVTGRFNNQPAWYSDAATYILRQQAANGSFTGEEGPVPATAFAALSLVRATREVIEKARGYGAGTLISGRGLPTGRGEVEVRMGSVVTKPLTGPAEELLNKLEQVDSPDYERAVEALEDLAREADVSRLSPVAQRLRKLAAGGPPEAKAAALRALARTRDFDNAPLLVAALRDPDMQVIRAAHEGLLFMTRRTGQPPLPAELSTTEREVLAKRWKEWLQTIQPDAAQ